VKKNGLVSNGIVDHKNLEWKMYITEKHVESMERNNGRSNSLSYYIDGDKHMSTGQCWSYIFCEPGNRRIQNRLRKCLQRRRGPGLLIVSL
jgi:hypothetical protein